MSISFHIERENLDHQSANAVLDAIINGELETGVFLKDTELATILGLSRSTTRTALKLLEMRGLVSHQPWSGGWQIFRPTSEDALHLYALRGCLEGLAASLVAGTRNKESLDAILEHYEAMRDAGKRRDMQAMGAADHAFHRQIVHEADNPRLRDQYALVQQHIQIYVAQANRLRKNFRDIVHDHDDMLKYLLEGKPKEADIAAREHSRVAGIMIANGITGISVV